MSESQKIYHYPCFICYEYYLQLALLPCGHFGLCTDCLTSIRRTTRCCPVCRFPFVNKKNNS